VRLRLIYRIEDKAASFDTYADVVCSALDEYRDDVGYSWRHFYGRFQIAPLIATRRTSTALFYLAALVPQIGLSLLEQMDPKSRQWSTSTTDWR